MAKAMVMMVVREMDRAMARAQAIAKMGDRVLDRDPAPIRDPAEIRDPARIQVEVLETATVMALIRILLEALMILPAWMIRVLILNGETVVIA